MGMGMGMGMGLLVLGSACLAKLFGTAHGVVTVGYFFWVIGLPGNLLGIKGIWDVLSPVNSG